MIAATSEIKNAFSNPRHIKFDDIHSRSIHTVVLGLVAMCLGSLEPERRKERQLWLGVASHHHNSCFGCVY